MERIWMESKRIFEIRNRMEEAYFTFVCSTFLA